MTSTTPTPGSLIGGKYRVERLLGEGGMGAVFSASNRNTGKRVAIKWMHPEVAGDPDARERFMREAQASARVQHPNVVDVYDVLEEGDSLFLVMEYLEGEALSDFMSREGTPLHELIALLVLAMRGVAAAHRQGIVHRDIKPENILLARLGDDSRLVPKVLDFGISKLSGTEEASLTKTGMALGTPIYMSIEQLSGVRDIDERTDIYAFGVILYQAVTGQAPYEADSFAVLIAKIMTELAPSPKRVRPDIPSGLASVIERAMAKDRNQRIPTMDTLIRELEPFASESGFRARMTIGRAVMPRVATPNSSSDTPSMRPTSVMPAVSPPRGFTAAQAAPSQRQSPQAATARMDTTRPPIQRQQWFALAVGVLAILVGIEIWWLLREPTAQPLAAPTNFVVPATPAVAVPVAAPPPAPAEIPTVVVEEPAPLPSPVRTRAKVAVTQAPVRIETTTTRSGTSVANPKPTITPRMPQAPKTPPRLRAGAPRSEDF